MLSNIAASLHIMTSSELNTYHILVSSCSPWSLYIKLCLWPDCLNKSTRNGNYFRRIDTQHSQARSSQQTIIWQVYRERTSLQWTIPKIEFGNKTLISNSKKKWLSVLIRLPHSGSSVLTKHLAPNVFINKGIMAAWYNHVLLYWSLTKDVLHFKITKNISD